LRRVAEPHTDLVALVPHGNHGAVDVLAVVVEGLPDETEHHLEPEVVEAPNPLFLVQVDEPPAATPVLTVLPHRLDALLEEAVVAA